MSYLVVFLILGILLSFHFAFWFIIRDGANQFLILGIYAFYGLCTAIKQIPEVTTFFENIQNELSIIIFFLFIVLDIYCAVIYLMHFLDNQVFRYGAGISLTAQTVIFIVTVIMWRCECASFKNFFFLSILIIGILSLTYALVFFILDWPTQSKYYRSIICATFVMIIWFLVLIGLNLSHFTHLAICGFGMGSYFVVYAIVSIMEINKRLNNKNDRKKQIKFTKKEKEIVEIMKEKNISSTKDIALYVDGTLGSIDTCIYRLISKYDVQTRKQLMDKIKQI